MTERLSERAEALLRTLIEVYVNGGQPVGSRTLAKEVGLELSPATIRNVMSDLEEMGYIRSPYTSAGRIPTALGYRFFVDTMLKVQPLQKPVIERLQGELDGGGSTDKLLSKASDVLSDLTHFAGVVTVPRQEHVRFRQIEFLQLQEGRILAILVTEDGRVQNRVIRAERSFTPSELVEAANYFNDKYRGHNLAEVRSVLLNEMKDDSDELGRVVRQAAGVARGLFEDDSDTEDESVVLRGERNLLDVPELAELDTLKGLFDAFKAKHDLLGLLDKSLRADGISIFIGDESGYQALNDCSVVVAPYEVDGEIIGVLGVIGPTRMAYEEVIPIVDVTARLLGSALSQSGDSGRVLVGS